MSTPWSGSTVPRGGRRSSSVGLRLEFWSPPTTTCRRQSRSDYAANGGDSYVSVYYPVNALWAKWGRTRRPGPPASPKWKTRRDRKRPTQGPPSPTSPRRRPASCTPAVSSTCRTSPTGRQHVPLRREKHRSRLLRDRPGLWRQRERDDGRQHGHRAFCGDAIHNPSALFRPVPRYARRTERLPVRQPTSTAFRWPSATARCR